MSQYIIEKVGDKWQWGRVSSPYGDTGAYGQYKYHFPDTLQGKEQAINQCNMLNNMASSSNQGSTGTGGGGVVDGLVGAAVVGGATLVGFGLKGIWKIITFPIWLMWMFFKGIFYTFPRFLWRKGKIGRICFGLYWLLWLVMMWVQHIGSEVVSGYITSNWVYLLIMGATLLVCSLVSIVLQKKLVFPTKWILVTVFSGLVIIGLTFVVGFFVTKDLTIIPEKNVYAYINASELNIRSGPSSEYEILTTLKKDVKIQVLNDGENGDWIKIKYNDIEGFVNKTFLREKQYQ